MGFVGYDGYFAGRMKVPKLVFFFGMLLHRGPVRSEGGSPSFSLRRIRAARSQS